MADQVARQIEWSGARVDAGKLSVPLIGEWDEDWNQSFKEAQVVLSAETRGGVWGEVTLIRDAITVAAVEKGSEEALKGFLESVVRQANSEVGRLKQQKHESAEQVRAEASVREADAERMTETFRDFGRE